MPLPTLVFLCYSALIASGLASCLYLFLSFKRELRKLERRALQRDELDGLRAEVAELSERLREAEERAGMLAPPTPPRSGLNLGKRSQALRMHRRGETPAQIAAALQLPETEVELLLKVHRIAVESLALDPVHSPSQAPAEALNGIEPGQ